MNQEQIAEFENLLKKSEFLMSRRQLKKGKKSVLLGDSCRSLTDKEVAALKSQGNRCDDWKQIQVTKEFKTDHIFDSFFSGKCVLGAFLGETKKVGAIVDCPSGIYRSNVMNSEIGNDCLISDVALLSNYIVKENAVIYQTDAMVCSGDTEFGNGIDIAIGPETGGRNIFSCAEITIPIAETVTTKRSDSSFQKSYDEFVRRYIRRMKVPYGIMEEGSIVLNTKKVEDVFIGRRVVIDGAVLVKNCTLLGSEEEVTEISHGTILQDTCVQWGSTITSGAVIEKSIIAEHARVERQALVTHSIIGPNAAIGEGEITSSLVGPFVASHHQSLLIASVWPGGKGNVGYGANVGSNHTSRAPDQELHCGEGMFFGLGVNIKFPADFSGAPYTIIATGVTTLPQRMELPFSLINTRSGHFPEIHPAYNEIVPAWVLINNLYMVKRSEDKFRERSLARRTHCPFEIFRADIIDTMIHARDLLNGVKKHQAIYTDEQIPEIGKNFLTEENRTKGVEAYGMFIEYYILKGLMKEVENWILEKRKKELASLYDVKTSDPVWKHQRKILFAEGYDKRSCQENLKRLIIIQNRIAADIKKCKEKDDNRGLAIIPDYKKVATSVSEDPVITGVQDETKKLQKVVSDLLNKIPK